MSQCTGSRQAGRQAGRLLCAGICPGPGIRITQQPTYRRHALTLSHTFFCSFPSLDFMHQCAVGFSGVLFGLLLVDAHLHGGARRCVWQ